MTKTKRLEKEVQDMIANDYGKIKAKILAEKHNCTLDQVYEVGRRYKLQQKQNLEVEIDEIMNQILLSGIIGDGRIKYNGKYNAQYSECHGCEEFEYLEWKFNNLKDLTSRTVIYGKNTKYDDLKDAKEFSTLTTPSLIPYKEIYENKEEVISRLNELGLLLPLLDDGCFHPYINNKNGRFTICTSYWTHEHRLLLIDKWKEETGISFHELGIKRVDIGASSSENQKLLNLALKYLPKDLDIIKKKFGIIMNNG